MVFGQPFEIKHTWARSRLLAEYQNGGEIYEPTQT
jgi:hypothetical protein